MDVKLVKDNFKKDRLTELLIERLKENELYVFSVQDLIDFLPELKLNPNNFSSDFLTNCKLTLGLVQDMYSFHKHDIKDLINTLLFLHPKEDFRVNSYCVKVNGEDKLAFVMTHQLNKEFRDMHDDDKFNWMKYESEEDIKKYINEKYGDK